MSKDSIVLLCPYLHHGGAEKQFSKMAEVLARANRFQLHIFCMSASEQDRAIGKEIESIGNANVYFLNRDPRSTGKMVLILLNIGLALKIAKRKPRSVYFYSLYFLPCLFLAVFKIDVFFSERILSDQTRNRKHLYPLLKFAKGIVVNSKSLLEFYAPYHKNRILIRNYVEPIKYQRLDLIAFGSPRVAVVSRLSPEKNIGFIIKTLSDAAHSINIYSSGEEKAYKQTLMLSTKGCQAQVTFHGHKGLAEIYSNNHLLVHASLFEGSPNVLLEAMASRFPCFASDIRENRDTGIHEFFLFTLNDNGEELKAKLHQWQNMTAKDREVLMEFNFAASRKFDIATFKENVLQLFSQ